MLHSEVFSSILSGSVIVVLGFETFFDIVKLSATFSCFLRSSKVFSKVLRCSLMWEKFLRHSDTFSRFSDVTGCLRCFQTF